MFLFLILMSIKQIKKKNIILGNLEFYVINQIVLL